MINHTNTTMNNITLTEAVKALHEVSPMMPVKDILENLNINHNHLKVDYRKVYNTLKRVSGNRTKKTPKMEKTSIILDLTIPATQTVKSVVYSNGY
jgi:hypothetical protein